MFAHWRSQSGRGSGLDFGTLGGRGGFLEDWYVDPGILGVGGSGLFMDSVSRFEYLWKADFKLVSCRCHVPVPRPHIHQQCSHFH